MSNTASNIAVTGAQPKHNGIASEGNNTTPKPPHRPRYAAASSGEVLRTANPLAVVTSTMPSVEPTVDARKKAAISTSKSTRAALLRMGLAYSAAIRWFKEHKNLIIQIVAVLAFAIGVIGLWPAITAASDSREARALAEWEAEKDFIEACQSHEWKSCEKIGDVELRPPPNFGRHRWSRRSWREAPFSGNDYNTQASLSFWSPMTASTAPFLFLPMIYACLALRRNPRPLLRILRQFIQRSKTARDHSIGFWTNTDLTRINLPRYNASVRKQAVEIFATYGDSVALLASSRETPSSDFNITISELRRRKMIHKHKKDRIKPGEWPNNKHALLDLESDSDREDLPVTLKPWVLGLKRRTTLGAKRRIDQSRLQLLSMTKCSHCGMAYAPDWREHARFCQKCSK